MTAAIHCTIDRFGRLVVPKSVREDAGLTAGMTLEIGVEDGVVQLRPAPADVVLEERDGVVVAVAKAEVPTLELDTVGATLDAVRARR